MRTALGQRVWARHFEIVAPLSRTNFVKLTSGWAFGIDRNIRTRLGEPEPKEQPQDAKPPSIMPLNHARKHNAEYWKNWAEQQRKRGFDRVAKDDDNADGDDWDDDDIDEIVEELGRDDGGGGGGGESAGSRHVAAMTLLICNTWCAGQASGGGGCDGPSAGPALKSCYYVTQA